MPNTEERILQSAAARGQSADQFLNSLLEKAAPKPIAPGLTVSKREGELLQKLDLNISEETWEAFYALQKKLQEYTITEPERAQYLEIIEEIEGANVERLEVLWELAQLRGVTLRQIMQDLGINSPNRD